MCWDLYCKQAANSQLFTRCDIVATAACMLSYIVMYKLLLYMIITIANNNSFKFIHSVVTFMHNEIVSLDG